MARKKIPIVKKRMESKLATTIEEWLGSNYGGETFPCRMCSHFYDTTRRLPPEEKNQPAKRICPLHPKGKVPVSADTEIRCKNFSMVTSAFYCTIVNQAVHPLVCAYRYFNDTIYECTKCDIGERMVDFQHNWLNEDVPEKKDISIKEREIL